MEVCRLPLRQRHVQCIEHELGLQVVAHGPSDNAPREGIEHDGQIQEPGPGRNIGDISDPQPVRFVGMEVALNRIASGPNPFVPEGCAPGFAAADADNTGRSHQPFHPLAADRDALIDEFSVDARRTIRLSRCPMDRLDASRQLRIGNGTGRGRTRAPGVEPASRNTESRAHG
jgi:hypothetical protein